MGTMMRRSPARAAVELGLDIPDYAANGYYGADYGTMKPFHMLGNLLFLSAMSASGRTGPGSPATGREPPSQ